MALAQSLPSSEVNNKNLSIGKMCRSVQIKHKILHILPKETCFEQNADYGSFMSQQFDNINDVQACQFQCQLNVNCKVFTYHASDRRCYIRTDDFSEKFFGEWIVGPRLCPGDVLLYKISIF